MATIRKCIQILACVVLKQNEYELCPPASYSGDVS